MEENEKIDEQRIQGTKSTEVCEGRIYNAAVDGLPERIEERKFREEPEYWS